MDNIYLIMLLALAVLAIADLVVGVSNDAVNFLNSAIGSKAVPLKTILIVASIGIAFGALSSSGMMEVARKGIFNPSQFYFDEIMIVFMAVMITDIILLDFFNSLGLPTSTTVSIVFELLGAAVCISLIKISKNSDSFLQLGEYINTDKATEIIFGILLSVFIAFTVGAIVQFIARYLLTFNFKNNPSWISAVFGGLAITAIAYFIIIKGLKGASILPESIGELASENLGLFLLANLGVWAVISFILVGVLKINIYKLVIVLGTFALAMAFAGNDLVNFIGVPMAGYQSYLDWTASGQLASEFSMESLAAKVPAQPLLLLFAGLIMVLTLWFSKKARRVVKTSVDLSTQDNVKERFKANLLSQYMVRGAISVNKVVSYLLPESLNNNFQKRFEPTTSKKILAADVPAFDMIRAAVNLVVASVLISVATGMKLPLSTTYVTFMVAMGSSLADKAWGSDSAVYRVAGVLNVIGGWFMTALIAFVVSAILALSIYYLELVALVVLFILAITLIIRNYFKSKAIEAEIKEELILKKAESYSLIGVIEESSSNVSEVMKRGAKLLSCTIDSLGKQDLKGLKKAQRQSEKLSDEIEDLNNHVFYYIKNLDNTSTGASRFYLLIQDSLQDIVQSFDLISAKSYKHVKNGHRGLKFNQIRDLKKVEEKLISLFEKVRQQFENQTLEDLPTIIEGKQNLLDFISADIEKQIKRTKEEESSAKNTSLYFTILLECKDLIEETNILLEQYYIAYIKSKENVVL